MKACADPIPFLPPSSLSSHFTSALGRHSEAWERVLCWMGLGHYLQITSISRAFKALYIKCSLGFRVPRWSTLSDNLRVLTFISVITVHQNLLEWAFSNGCPRSGRVAVKAAMNGGLPVLQTAIARGCAWEWLDQICEEEVNVCTAAAARDDLAMMQWARTEGCPWDENWTFTKAASCGSMELLRWLQAAGCPIMEHFAWSSAARAGRLEVLQWAHSQGFSMASHLYYYAAESGRLHIMQWLRSLGCMWYDDTCAAAAAGGHLEVLQWARANGCQWGRGELCARVCERAAERGQLHVLKWAVANGCLWQPSVCLTRAEACRQPAELLAWIREHLNDGAVISD